MQSITGDVTYDVNIDLNQYQFLDVNDNIHNNGEELVDVIRNVEEINQDRTATNSKKSSKRKCAAVNCKSQCVKYHSFPSVSSKTNNVDIFSV